MKQKKNGLFTLLFSFIPGAAEMYTGFMINGTSLMGVFFVLILIPIYLRLHIVFLLPAVLSWFYSFFHARNLVRLDDTAIAAKQDTPFWNEGENCAKVYPAELIPARWAPTVLILLGAAILWSCVTDIIPYTDKNYYLHKLMDNAPQAAVAVFLIILGVRMRKKNIQAQCADISDAADLPIVAAEPAEEGFTAAEEVSDGTGRALPAAEEKPQNCEEKTAEEKSAESTEAPSEDAAEVTEYKAGENIAEEKDN